MRPICEICHAYMLIHEQTPKFRKCRSCGFCKEIHMPISKEELLKGRDKTYASDYTEEVSDNLDKLLIPLNKIRDAYGQAMVCTSGWRPESLNAGVPGAAKKSKHIIGLAADFSDPDGKLMNWVLENLDMMKKLNIYMEDFRWTNSWVHFQLGPPVSGHRIFIPSSAPPLAPNRWISSYDAKYD